MSKDGPEEHFLVSGAAPGPSGAASLLVTPCSLLRSQRKTAQHSFESQLIIIFNVLFQFIQKKRGVGPVVPGGFGLGLAGRFGLITVVNKVIVAGFFGNRGRGLGNLDVL